MAAPEIVRVLQSGFLAYDSSCLSVVPRADKTVTQTIVDNDVYAQDHDNCYDTEVTELWKTFCQTPEKIKDIFFREKIIVAVKRLFDDNRIDTWLKMQLSSNTVSYSHECFLIETLEYLYFDKTRPLSHDMYYHILTPKVGADKRKDSDVKLKQARSLSAVLADFDNVETLAFVKRSTSSYEKLTDLLRTLNVIFGRRTQAFTAREQRR